jgi:hypothetical protein
MTTPRRQPPDDNPSWQPPDDNPTWQQSSQMTTPDDNNPRWQHQVTTAPSNHLTSDNGDNDLDDNISMTTWMRTGMTAPRWQPRLRLTWHLRFVIWIGIWDDGCHLGVVIWGLSSRGCHLELSSGLSGGGCHLGVVIWCCHLRWRL